jgi:hypothetical protein
VKLEDQRSKVRLAVSEGIPEMSTYECIVVGCTLVHQSKTFMHSLKDAIGLNSEWPPTFSSLTVRFVLEKIRNAGDVYLGPTSLCQHRNAVLAGLPQNINQSAESFRVLANDTNDNMAGMCLLCVKSGSYAAGPCQVQGHWKPRPGWKDEL